jgi:hypothetical protein
MPQPIDFNTEGLRQHAADRIQEIAARQSLAAQQRLAIQDQEERVEHETQVQDTQESQEQAVDEEGRRKNPFIGRRKRKKRDTGAALPPTLVYTPQEKNEVAGNLEGWELDISI